MVVVPNESIVRPSPSTIGLSDATIVLIDVWLGSPLASPRTSEGFLSSNRAVAVAAVALSTFLKVHFDWVGRDAPVAIYLGTILFVAWFGGTGPGLVATTLSSVAIADFFAAPYDSLAVASGEDAFRLVIAAGEGAFISLLAGALRRTSDELRKELRKENRDRLRAEAALRRTNEQAVHAHRMRAIGEFAGSVAHDFNNMLTIVQACVGLLERRLPSDHAARAEVAEIRSATERAVALARQLLTFARRRKLEPTRVPLHDLLTRLRPIVCRLVGPSIHVELALGASTDLVLADVAQLEQAIVNLAANGRDAMPDGGTLTITTSDASPAACAAHALRKGPHLALSVQDSGIGMDDDTKRRAFEPFFTTKVVGAGTGLGLPMVFGVVDALGGAIAIDSAPGKGTTVRMLLPVAEAETALGEGKSG